MPTTKPRPRPPPARTPTLHTETAALVQRLNDLSAVFADGHYHRLPTQHRHRQYSAPRLADIEDTLASTAAVNLPAELVGQPNIADIWYGTTLDRFDGLDLGRRRAVLTKLITVTVLPTGHGRRPDGTYFDPIGIHITRKTS